MVIKNLILFAVIFQLMSACDRSSSGSKDPMPPPSLTNPGDSSDLRLTASAGSLQQDVEVAEDFDQITLTSEFASASSELIEDSDSCDIFTSSTRQASSWKISLDDLTSLEDNTSCSVRYRVTDGQRKSKAILIEIQKKVRRPELILIEGSLNQKILKFADYKSVVVESRGKNNNVQMTAIQDYCNIFDVRKIQENRWKVSLREMPPVDGSNCKLQLKLQKMALTSDITEIMVARNLSVQPRVNINRTGNIVVTGEGEYKLAEIKTTHNLFEDESLESISAAFEELNCPAEVSVRESIAFVKSDSPSFSGYCNLILKTKTNLGREAQAVVSVNIRQAKLNIQIGHIKDYIHGIGNENKALARISFQWNGKSRDELSSSLTILDTSICSVKLIDGLLTARYLQTEEKDLHCRIRVNLDESIRNLSEEKEFAIHFRDFHYQFSFDQTGYDATVYPGEKSWAVGSFSGSPDVTIAETNLRVEAELTYGNNVNQNCRVDPTLNFDNQQLSLVKSTPFTSSAAVSCAANLNIRTFNGGRKITDVATPVRYRVSPAKQELNLSPLGDYLTNTRLSQNLANLSVVDTTSTNPPRLEARFLSSECSTKGSLLIENQTLKVKLQDEIKASVCVIVVSATFENGFTANKELRYSIKNVKQSLQLSQSSASVTSGEKFANVANVLYTVNGKDFSTDPKAKFDLYLVEDCPANVYFDYNKQEKLLSLRADGIDRNVFCQFRLSATLDGVLFTSADAKLDLSIGAEPKTEYVLQTAITKNTVQADGNQITIGNWEFFENATISNRQIDIEARNYSDNTDACKSAEFTFNTNKQIEIAATIGNGESFDCQYILNVVAINGNPISDDSIYSRPFNITLTRKRPSFFYMTCDDYHSDLTLSLQVNVKLELTAYIVNNSDGSYVGFGENLGFNAEESDESVEVYDVCKPAEFWRCDSSMPEASVIFNFRGNKVETLLRRNLMHILIEKDWDIDQCKIVYSH